MSHKWEEAMDEISDDLDEVLTVLDNIVSLWDADAHKADLENAVSRARWLLKKYNKEKK
jgi:ElaB/YqjD/DUF883 family membrane-anchored ribosome-binding protein